MSTSTGVGTIPSDPPVPNRITRIAPPSPAMAARDNFNIGILAGIAFVIAAICLWTRHSVPAYILGGLGLVFIISMFTKKSDVGQCPYCMAEFRETVAVKDKLLRCEQCGEYSKVTNKTLKPLPSSTYSAAPKFESPVFKNGSMPNACMGCGAPATRLDTVTTSSVNKTLAAVGAARLVTGAPGVAIFSSQQASITVPYCDQHRDAIALGFDWRKRAVLTWSSLRMMRRYLMLNRGKESTESSKFDSEMLRCQQDLHIASPKARSFSPIDRILERLRQCFKSREFSCWLLASRSELWQL